MPTCDYTCLKSFHKAHHPKKLNKKNENLIGYHGYKMNGNEWN
jgi:hypothetical protein